MTAIKLHIQLTALLCSLIFSGTVLAEEATKNENKNIRTSNTVSNADLTDHVGSNFKRAVKKQPDHAYSLEQWQRQQLEAYKQHLLDRNSQLNKDRNIPVDVQHRRNEYIKRVQQRREFFNKLIEQHRQEAEQRMEMMRKKMYRTSTYHPAPADS